MSPIIRFDHERMHELRDMLERAVKGIEAELDELDRQVASLRPLWSGEARDAYLTAHDKWRADLAVLQDALQQSARIAGDTADTFKTADAAVAKLFSD